MKGKGGKVNNMCEFLDKIENEGIAKGMEQGIAQGKNESLEQIILKMLENDVTEEQISLYTGASEEKIKEMKAKLVCVK